MTVLQPNRGIVSAPAPTVFSGPVEAPSLWWAASWWEKATVPSVDLRKFPDISERAQRRDEKRLIASIEFRRSLRQASRLWILDTYFDPTTGVPALEEALLDAVELREVKINGWKDVEPDFVPKAVRHFQSLISDAARGCFIPEVAWINTLTSDTVLGLHDRFAIVDNELWHFGATVGGGHRSVNAFSRGWDAQETGAVQFFNDLWV